MAKRVSDEIDGVDVFTYDTDLLANAHGYTRLELIELARHRKYRGLSKMRKNDLAIIVADTWTAVRDESRKLPKINAWITETLDESGFRVDAGAIKPSADDVAELHDQAAAIDEKRTVARAYLCTPDGVVLSWAEIEQGYLDAMAERDRIEHNQVVRAEQQHVDDLLSLLNNPPTVAEMIKTHPDTADVDDLGRRVQTTASGHLISLPAPADEPRELDTWLTHGMVLVGPQTGDRYRFLRWDGGWAVVRHEADGTEMRIAQADVTAWQYLPEASAKGIAAAKPVHVRHRNGLQIYTFEGMRDDRVFIRCVDGVGGLFNVTYLDFVNNYRAVCAHGNGVGETCQWCGAEDEFGNQIEPPYAIGDRVRWTKDQRPMFVRQVGFTGAYVAPTMYGTYMALARFEDLSPEPGFFYPAGMARAEAMHAGWSRLKTERDAAEAQVAELIKGRTEARDLANRRDLVLINLAVRLRELAAEINAFRNDNR